MKKCRLCGRSGLLFSMSLNAEGYCPTCAKHEKEFEERRARERRLQQEAEAQAWAKIEAVPVFQLQIYDRRYKRQTGYEAPTFSNITPKGRYDDVVVFDTETTGLYPSRDRIVEIAAVRFVDEKPVARFQSYVNPEREIPEAITKINGITQDQVADAPSIAAVLPEFDDFVGASTLVAHNLDFDLRFIFYSGSQVLTVKRKYIDTLEQGQRFDKKPRDVDNHKLATLCQYHRITIAKEHSALCDAFATGELFFRYVDQVQRPQA